MMKKIIEIAHEMLAVIFTPENLVLDTILRRGYDTRFLSSLVKKRWHLIFKKKPFEVLEFQYIHEQSNPFYLMMIERIAL